MENILNQIKIIFKKIENKSKIIYNTINDLESKICIMNKNNQNENFMIIPENKQTITIFDIVKYFIKNQNSDDFTHLKLQKLVYLAYIKYLIDYNQEINNNISVNTLFQQDKQFQSWGFGPVHYDLFLEFKFGCWKKHPSYYNFQKNEPFLESFNENKFNSQQKKF